MGGARGRLGDRSGRAGIGPVDRLGIDVAHLSIARQRGSRLPGSRMSAARAYRDRARANIRCSTGGTKLASNGGSGRGPAGSHRGSLCEFAPAGKRFPYINSIYRRIRRGKRASPRAPGEVHLPEFFQTLGVPLLAGRDLEWAGYFDQRAVAMVSASLATEVWGSPREALGKHVRTIRPIRGARSWGSRAMCMKTG